MRQPAIVRLSLGQRRGYTLLEVLLASTIGVLLMGALYVAVDVQLRHAQTGREIIQQSTLARALLTRIGADISSSLGPYVPPTSSSASSQGAGGGGAAGGGSPGGTSTSGSTAGGMGASTGTSNTSSSSTTTTSGAGSGTVQFNLGVQGDNQHVVLYVSKFPRELNIVTDMASQDSQAAVSDLRRITYWLAGGADAPFGLARQEIKVVTSDDLMSAVPPDVPDEASFVIAEEIKSLQFRYFDGSSWQDSWDGTAAGADGSTPMGPPLAIEITVGVAPPGVNVADNPDSLKTYRHVVALLTANGATQATTTSAGTTTSTTSQ